MNTHFALRQHKNTFRAISVSQSHRGAGQWHPHDTRPFAKSLSNTIERYHMTINSITGLFFFSSPSTVIWFIMSVIINAVKRVLRRRLSAHYLQKLWVIIKQELNTATAIPFIGVVCDFFTSFLCVSIRTIFGCDVFPRFIVYSQTLSCQFVSVTSTRMMRLLSSQNRTSLYGDLSTFTLAPPRKLFARTFTSAKPQNGQKIINVSSEVNKAGMVWKRFKNNGILVVGHIRSYLANVIKVVRGSNLCQPFYIVAQGVA